MNVWDAAQRTMVDALEHQWAEHEKLDQLTDDSDAHQEAAEAHLPPHGGEYWMGGAQGRAAPRRHATLYGGAPPVRESSPPAPRRSTPPTPTPEGRAHTAAALAASTP
jgi:hypothetical protein